MKYFLLVLQIVPALIEMIKAIEAAIPGTGKGEQKLAAVREIIETAYEQSGEIWPVVQKVIGILVSLFNSTGAFTTSKPVIQPEP